MAKSRLGVFNNVSLDGYFTDRNGDSRWGYQNDPEWNNFINENAVGGGVLLFGRVTYDTMASYWPTEDAIKTFPLVAKRLNSGAKVVFSRTLDKVSWGNTRLVKSDLVAEVRRMKEEGGEDLIILGSGSIVAQLAKEGLIDTYEVAIHPIALGQGRTMFEGIKNSVALKLVKSRIFGNGCVVLTYEAI